MSSNIRYNAKRDSNEGDIVDYLRKAGCSVERISGTGIPDLLVGLHGLNLLMEVKVPGKKLRESQEEWHMEWKGQRVIVETVDEAAAVIASYRERLRGME